ncbi:ATP-binding protein [Pannus brasiliensis CCIBt3594]|uniref:histidine kinase n=1 Tax=Pannus brasiliensis CCIBt3594 TaxID=1427578 RepID=A0AAW9QJS7_9CHRO
MNERARRETLDEITDFLLNSEDLDSILAFCREGIRRVLSLDRVTVSREKDEEALLSLPIRHRGENWGNLALYGDRSPIGPGDREFLDRAIKLIRLGLQKTAVHGQGRRSENLPREKPIDGGTNDYPDPAAGSFPEEKRVADRGIETFSGTGPIDPRGEAIGSSAVFSSQPPLKIDIPSDILQIFAVRAAAEQERQTLLDSLRESNENLEERVRQRTGDLTRAIERLNSEIEERARVEAALRKSEERYRNLVTMLPYGVQECDRTGTITYSNPASERIFGLEPGESIGSRIWDRLANEEEKRELQEYLRFLDRERPAPTPYRSVSRKGTGETFDVQIDWTYLRDDSGQLTGYLSIISDITERRRAEREIQRALEKERELNQLKTEFIDIASHEFRTPLTVILGSIQFLLKRYRQLPEERCLEHFQRVYEAGIQIRELIEEMLTVSRVDSGRITIDRRPIALDRLARDLIEEIRVGSDNERSFVLQIANLPETVCLDRKLLYHILTNLLFNAVKYSDKNSRIDLAIEGRGDRAIFTVIDRGIGIPPEDGDRVFESFHRGRNVGAIPGTGLGLKIAKMYVEAMNGTISFTSQPGRGSTFVVSLPL